MPGFADSPVLSPRARIGVIAAIVVIHVLLAIALVRAFGGVRALADRVGLGPVLVAIAPPVAPPAPPGKTVITPAREGASGTAAQRANADQIVAPPPRMAIPAAPAAPVAGTGSETRSGASASGLGTGGSGAGAGPGSGGAGNGSGGRYAVTRPVKIAGELSEKDYPRAGRAKRLDTAVIVVLTVGKDGRVSDCAVREHSGDPEADAVTCQLATQRFRFTSAVDQNGDPVAATYGWQQRFFWQSAPEPATVSP